MRCFVIAEAGVNHNGDLALACRLIDAAAEAGADAVKFQTFTADALVTAEAPKARYQNRTTGEGTQLEMLRALELSAGAHRDLKKYAEERGLIFASTPFDMASVDLLDELDVHFIKIPSGEVTNYPLLRHIAAKGRPVILSTGMSTLDEVQSAVAWLGEGPCASDRLPALSVLHCVTAYPAANEQLNLRCIETLVRDLNLPIGYSDHSTGIEMPIAAVALGATVVEKHFTLDRSLPGPDHEASLEPIELKHMISAIRAVECALGSGIKAPASCEAENISVVRRSIVAKRDIRAGETFSDENLTTKRPATGISPAQWPNVIGQQASRHFRREEQIEL